FLGGIGVISTVFTSGSTGSAWMRSVGASKVVSAAVVSAEAAAAAPFPPVTLKAAKWELKSAAMAMSHKKSAPTVVLARPKGFEVAKFGKRQSKINPGCYSQPQLASVTIKTDPLRPLLNLSAN
ncbi:MAG: hypothetical protein DCC75_02075, partial [Proteobacteria bacterium]